MKRSAAEKSFSWQTNLLDTGYSAIVLPPDGSVAGAELLMYESARLDYLDEQTILVSFVRQNTAFSGLQRRDDPHRVRPYILHSMFLDAATGKVISKRDWLSDIPSAFVIPRDDGQSVFFDAARLTSYSRDGAETGQVILHGPQKNISTLWGVSISRTGRTVFVQFRGDDQASCEWVNTVAMTDNVEACALPRYVAITDDQMAIFDPDPKKPREGTLKTAKLGKTWTDVCESKSMPACQSFQIVGSDLLVQDSAEFALIDDYRTVLFHRRVPEFTLLGPIVSARNAPKLAAITYPEPRGVMVVPSPSSGTFAVRSLSGPARLVIYDLNDAKWDYSIEFVNDVKDVSLAALSPTGRQAVIFAGGFLRCYEVPEPAATK